MEKINPKKIAIIVAAKAKEQDNESLVKDILKAIKNNDISSLETALKDFIYMCK